LFSEIRIPSITKANFNKIIMGSEKKRKNKAKNLSNVTFKNLVGSLLLREKI